jgi:hypothetical protein
MQMAETVVAPGARPGSRDGISAKLVYMAYINPGGWAPASVVKCGVYLCGLFDDCF